MKKRTIVILALFLLFGPQCFAQGALNDLTDEFEPQNRTLLNTFSEIQNHKQQLLGKEIELQQLIEKGPPSGDEVKNLSETLQKLKDRLIDFKQEKTPDLNSIAALEQEVLEREQVLTQRTQIFQADNELYEQKTESLKIEIEEITAQIDMYNALAKSQLMTLLMRIAFILAFLVAYLLLRIFIGKILNKFSRRMPLQRERALARIVRIVFDLFIGIIIVVTLFSQVLSFLPFLAILGTALAFAMRDIISSFIAWFIIGTEEGYKIGDLIQTGKLRGRVIEVHPLLTVLRQTGLRGDTGRIVSFPNKYIFEQEVQNFSKMYRFIYIMVNFILDRNSDIDIAKATLIETILEVTARDHEEAKKNLPNLLSRFGLTPNHIEPQLFIEPDPRGILLRGKYFCRLENRHKSRSEITELFFRKVQHIKNVDLRLVEFGESKEDNLMIETVNF